MTHSKKTGMGDYLNGGLCHFFLTLLANTRLFSSMCFLSWAVKIGWGVTIGKVGGGVYFEEVKGGGLYILKRLAG